MTKKVIN